MIFNYIIDHTPLWVWLVLIASTIGVLLFYFSPILLPIWRMLPTPAKAGLVFVGGLLLAFLGGRYRGRADADEEERRRNAEALRKRNEVDRNVQSMPESDVKSNLDRWRRD